MYIVYSAAGVLKIPQLDIDLAPRLLSPNNASCVLGTWTKLDGAIPRDDIIQLFKDKSQWLKKKQKVAEVEEDKEVIMVD